MPSADHTYTAAGRGRDGHHPAVVRRGLDEGPRRGRRRAHPPQLQGPRRRRTGHRARHRGPQAAHPGLADRVSRTPSSGSTTSWRVGDKVMRPAHLGGHPPRATSWACRRPARRSASGRSASTGSSTARSSRAGVELDMLGLLTTIGGDGAGDQRRHDRTGRDGRPRGRQLTPGPEHTPVAGTEGTHGCPRRSDGSNRTRRSIGASSRRSSTAATSTSSPELYDAGLRRPQSRRPARPRGSTGSGPSSGHVPWRLPGRAFHDRD